MTRATGSCEASLTKWVSVASPRSSTVVLGASACRGDVFGADENRQQAGQDVDPADQNEDGHPRHQFDWRHGRGRPRDDQPHRIAVIAATAHMHALACIDANLRAIGPALILGDRRAADDADAITAEVGAATVYAITGTAMDASMPAAKVRWLAVHEPETLAATAWLLGCKDYLRACLTGEVATEPVDACATSMYDIRMGEWSAPMAAATRAPLEALPPIRAPESLAGPLLPAPAAELGLPAGRR